MEAETHRKEAVIRYDEVEASNKQEKQMNDHIDSTPETGSIPKLTLESEFDFDSASDTDLVPDMKSEIDAMPESKSKPEPVN